MAISKVLSLLILLQIGCACFELNPPPLPKSQLPPGKVDDILEEMTIVFVADLHLWVGRDLTKKECVNTRNSKVPAHCWHNYEDFRWHKEFKSFLKWLVAPETELGDIVLVFLGDTFELWQSLEDDCDHSQISKNFGCTELEASKRMVRIVQEHGEFFYDVAEFASKGRNRVTFVIGNHDIALVYSKVREVLKNRFNKDINLNFPKARGRIRIASEGYWLSGDSKIFAEHGQQIGMDPNHFKGWPHFPFWKVGVTTYLDQPWGEQFVQEFFNTYEQKYPVIDNLWEEIEGMNYAIEAGGIIKTFDAIGKATRFVLTQTSFNQNMGILGDSEIPEWDIKGMVDVRPCSERKREKRPCFELEKQENFLIESFPLEHPYYHLLQLAKKENQPIPNITDLTPEEIRVICNRRWAFNQTNPKKKLEECLRRENSVGFIVQNVVESLFDEAENSRFKDHLKSIQKSIPITKRPNSKFDYFIYGHTHRTDYKNPFKEDEKWTPKVINIGAWQRTASTKQICSIVKNYSRSNHIPENKVFENLKPEDLPACYPFLIAYKNKKYNVDSFYLVQDSDDENGQYKPTCLLPFEIPLECR